MLPINKILAIIQEEVFLGCEFLSKIGMAFLVMFIVVELIKGGIEATSGRGFSLDKTLYLYLFLAILYAFYPKLQFELKKYAYEFCEAIYKDFGSLNFSVNPTFEIFTHIWDSIKASPFKAILTLPITLLGTVLIYVFSFVVALLSMIAIDIVVLGAFLGFEITLAAGPFFIPFLMSSDMSHIAKQWVNNILMYCVQFPLIALVLKLVERLNTEVAQKIFYEQFVGKNQFLDAYVVVFTPLLGLGLLWQALNLSKMLFPPSGGFLGTSIGAPVAAGAAYVLNKVEKGIEKAAAAAMS
jgi:hypothetical protein